MKLRSCVILLAVIPACERRGHDGEQRSPPDSGAQVAADGLFGYPRSEYPTDTGFKAIASAREGNPAATEFEHGIANSDYTRGVVIDLKSDVWRYVAPGTRKGVDWKAGVRPANARFVRVGRIDQSVLSRMRALKQSAVSSELNSVPIACDDCDDGASFIAVDSMDPPYNSPVELAYTRGETERRRAPESHTLVRWVLAVSIEVLARPLPPPLTAPSLAPSRGTGG